jgi:uncharacterized phage protein (TIGR01671 family)
MREIIFKAQTVHNDEWVQGDLIHGQGNKKGNMYILPHAHIYPHGCSDLDGWLVKPETVSQWTGLLDKNGNKIWEGDLMGGGHLGFIATVTFNDGMFQLVTSEHQGNSPLVQDRAKRIEVIGNIFDNPELLNQ